ncbi:MAG: hypothetical protein RML95_13380 [Anaerolineae bacterium]|nr:hypothetical protein [Anaerolineae bacterium]MDW8300319.1 hypothetical protein [Anaerolineae bacterium]
MRNRSDYSLLNGDDQLIEVERVLAQYEVLDIPQTAERLKMPAATC